MHTYWREVKEDDLRLKIVQAGEAVLRQTARALTRGEIAGDEIQRLIQDMKETMQDAPGVGLAAPQVGLPLRLAVIEDREELLKGLPPQEVRDKERRPVPFHVTINPDIAFSRDDTVDFYEGCLSLAGFSAVVPRARTIQVKYLDEHGEHQLESFLESETDTYCPARLVQGLTFRDLNAIVGQTRN